jgi:hypothetical protein
MERSGGAHPGSVCSSSREGRSRGVLRPKGMAKGLFSSCEMKVEGPFTSIKAREWRKSGAWSRGVGRATAAQERINAAYISAARDRLRPPGHGHSPDSTACWSQDMFASLCSAPPNSSSSNCSSYWSPILLDKKPPEVAAVAAVEAVMPLKRSKCISSKGRACARRRGAQKAPELDMADAAPTHSSENRRWRSQQ